MSITSLQNITLLNLFSEDLHSRIILSFAAENKRLGRMHRFFVSLYGLCGLGSCLPCRRCALWTLPRKLRTTPHTRLRWTMSWPTKPGLSLKIKMHVSLRYVFELLPNVLLLQILEGSLSVVSKLS